MNNTENDSDTAGLTIVLTFETSQVEKFTFRKYLSGLFIIAGNFRLNEIKVPEYMKVKIVKLFQGKLFHLALNPVMPAPGRPCSLLQTSTMTICRRQERCGDGGQKKCGTMKNGK